MKVIFSVEENLQLLEQSDQQALRPRMFAQCLWPSPYLRVCSRCHLCPWSSPLLSRPRHWYLRPLREAINQGVGVKEDWGTWERVREADHCRAPVHHLSSGGRGGVSRPYLCFTMSLGKRSVQPSLRRSSAPSRKSPTKLQSVVQVVPRPILPKPQHRLWHCSPLDDLSKPGSVHDRRPDKRL